MLCTFITILFGCVEAAPTGDASTTSEWSTILLSGVPDYFGRNKISSGGIDKKELELELLFFIPKELELELELNVKELELELNWKKGIDPSPAWHPFRCWAQHIEAETNGRHFSDDIFKCLFLNENVLISIKISLKFVAKGQINNIPALVQIMAWCRPGDKPLSEPMMVVLPTHICVTRPPWVKGLFMCVYPSGQAIIISGTGSTCGFHTFSVKHSFDGLVQERRNSSALAMELCLSCTNPSIWTTAELLSIWPLGTMLTPVNF